MHLARRVPILALCALPFFHPGAAIGQSRPDTLVGLWKAWRSFGSAARGPLVIQRSGGAYTADMVGKRVPVRSENGELRFELPDEEGSFRGRMETDGVIRGIWIAPNSPAMGGRATPVTLAPRGADRWDGDVVPFDDTFTFYLKVTEEPDGTLTALLRNMERDFGALLGVQRLEREGNEVKLIGRPPWEKEPVAVSSGRYDPELDVLTLWFDSRGGSYDFQRDGDDSAFYPRGRNPEPYVYRPPLARDDGWTTGTLEEAGIDRAAMERAVQVLVDLPMDSVNAPQVHGFLIARHGKLVLEEYFHGQHRDMLHETRSASKSVTATIAGAAMEAGEPVSLSTPVYATMSGGSLPTDLDPRKRAMTLEDLLTMSSGFYCDDSDPDAPGNEDGMSEQEEEPDFYRFTMAVPMAYAPGDTAIYCSANPNLGLGVVGRATGEWPVHKFRRLVADPMRIERYAWGLDPAGNPYGGGGMQFLPRDFMKFGQLMLDGGVWNGRRILSRAFVERASSPLFRIGTRGYGIGWWSEEFPYQGRTVAAFEALGAGGQTVTVVPELDLVVTSYGGSYSSRGWRYFLAEFLPRYVLPAVR